MADTGRTRGLGRGLSALLGEEDAPSLKAATAAAAKTVDRESDTELAIELMEPNPFQPRRTFAEDDLRDLVASVKERGIIQPIIVRPKPGVAGQYQIIAGERRWRAAQRAKLHQVPVRIKEFDDAQALEIAIIENVQRADLNAIEESLGYRQLMDEFSYTQEKLAQFIGKSRSHIANMLRLLSLPEAVQVMLADGRLSAGHGRAILASDNMSGLAHEIVTKGLSVREAEALAKKGGIKSAGKKHLKPPKDPDTRALEQRISQAIGLRVSIDAKGEKGDVTINFKTLEQLDDICKRLMK